MDGIVLGVNVVVDLVSSEDSKGKRDAGWGNAPVKLLQESRNLTGENRFSF